MQTQAKQIKKLFSGYITIPSKTVTSGIGYIDIDAEVITALATAGFLGNSVVVTPSTGENIPGLIVSEKYNFVEIAQNPALVKLAYLGKEIYGRLTYITGPHWRITFYYLNASGIETRFTLNNNYDFRFNIPYRFELKDLPTDFVLKFKTDKIIDAVGTNTNSILYTQLLTVSARNTLSSLEYLPYLPINVSLIVNGEVLNHIGITKPFTVIGQVITWYPLIAGYDLEVTDRVVAQYLVQL